jgi:hypothetical protein
MLPGMEHERMTCHRCPHPVACSGVSCHFGEAGIEQLTAQLVDGADGGLMSSIVGFDVRGQVVYSTTLSVPA